MSDKRKIIDMPVMQRAATVEPKSFNEERNTVDVVFSTGARVKRMGFFSDDFFEELSMDEKAVRLDRLNSGAPLLNNHRSSDLEDIIGVVEKASVTGKKGVATVRLSERESVAPIVRDIKSGIIRNISVGYTVHRFEELDKKVNGLSVFRATDWEPMEISAVPIGADSKAQFRSEASEIKTRCEVIMETRNEQPEKSLETPAEQPEEKRSLETSGEIGSRSTETEVKSMDEKKVAEIKKDAATEGALAERKRIAEIKRSVAAAGLETSFADEHIESGAGIDEVRAAVIEKLEAKSKEQPVRSANVEIVRDQKDTLLRGAEVALLHRHMPGSFELTDEAKAFRYMSLFDIAKEVLSNEGVNVRLMPKMELAGRALHSSSDFPLILENIATKNLQRAFAERGQSFAPFVTETTVPDFKEVSRPQMGDAPVLKKVAENGEFLQGTISEDGEKYKLSTYGRLICFSRQMLINDDMRSFQRVTTLFGIRARELEGDLVWAQVVNNPTMGDGNALFSGAHANVGIAGALDPADLTELQELRQLMRKQKGLDGARIAVRPTWLVVPPELESKADQIVTAITPNSNGQANPFGPGGRNSLQVVVEDRLSDTSFSASASATRYYAFADVSQTEMIELARLEGESGPVIETQDGFRVDGMEIKARHDVVAKVLEYRGMTKNDGA